MKREYEIVWDPAKSTADNARGVLPKLTEEFFAAGRKATKKTKKLKLLHEFRIKAKGFRYTLEMFQSLYGPVLESRLDGLKQIQQYLGDINDCDSTRRLLSNALGGDGFLASQLQETLDATERKKIRKLVAYWQETFDAPGEEEKWTRYLRDYAGRSKSAAE